MFLKRLSINGFKSFADPTAIEFCDGITALLGPNGCGKSNVVDAIKWVLGEQATKSLRAEKMEDVIFNGTETRKATGMADVTLTIDNENGILSRSLEALGLPDMPEVGIRRRLYRSGAAEYYIGSQQVKLKNIRELFWDTGVGKAAYSVMEQGKIDQILSSRPDERRYLFEEAAGITRYKVQGAEAERNLARAEENMQRTTMILNEVKRDYNTLKVQSEKTLLYRSLRDKIFNYDLDIQLLRLKQFKYERDGRRENLNRRTQDRDRIREEMEAENKALEANMDAVNSMEAQLIKMEKNIYGLALEKNALEKEVRLLDEQQNENTLKIEQNEIREKQIRIKIEELSADAAKQDEVVKDLRKKSASIEENIRAFEQNIQNAAERIRGNEAAVIKADEEIHNLENEEVELEKDLGKITDDIVAELDAGLKKAGYSAAERRNAEASLEETLGKVRTILSGRELLIRDLLKAAETATDSTGIAPAEVTRIAQRLADSLTEAAADADKAIDLFKNYQKHTPSFIDEFLAPEGIITKKRTLDARIRNTKDSVEERWTTIKNLRNENAELGIKINEYRTTLENLRVSRAQMDAQAQSAEEQARLIRRELAGQEVQLKNLRDEIDLYRRRVKEIDERITETKTKIAELGLQNKKLTAELAKLEKDIQKRNGDVAGRQAAIKKRTAELSKVQEALEKNHLELVQSETEIKSIQENFRETYSRDLMEFEERMYTIADTMTELREKLGAARTKFKDLGSVNMMAPEEFTEKKERYEFLSNEMADLEKARKHEEALAVEIRTKSAELFLATYNLIKRNFHNMFRRLFGGGRAELQLSDPNHVLESGIEIFAQPPGKKLEHISLLSGGERSMTAVALLFATYRVKPSPFCLLDEIDAALDEANVIRFVQLLREFGSTSQFVVITHNHNTMPGAGTLIGVTMEEPGITKVISVRIENDELVRIGEPPQHGLWDSESSFIEENVEPEEGCELPKGIDDPKKVSDSDLRPIRSVPPDSP